jgi:hypothetical protein
MIVSELLLLARVGAIVRKSDAIPTSFIDMAINAIVANIHLGIRIPPMEILVRGIQDLLWLLGPYDILGLFCPKGLLILDGTVVFGIMQGVRKVVGSVSVSNVL